MFSNTCITLVKIKTGNSCQYVMEGLYNNNLCEVFVCRFFSGHFSEGMREMLKKFARDVYAVSSNLLL